LSPISNEISSKNLSQCSKAKLQLLKSVRKWETNGDNVKVSIDARFF
jgi:hypothetical protein